MENIFIRDQMINSNFCLLTTLASLHTSVLRGDSTNILKAVNFWEDLGIKLF